MAHALPISNRSGTVYQAQPRLKRRKRVLILVVVRCVPVHEALPVLVDGPTVVVLEEARVGALEPLQGLRRSVGESGREHPIIFLGKVYKRSARLIQFPLSVYPFHRTFRIPRTNEKNNPTCPLSSLPDYRYILSHLRHGQLGRQLNCLCGNAPVLVRRAVCENLRSDLHVGKRSFCGLRYFRRIGCKNNL